MNYVVTRTTPFYGALGGAPLRQEGWAVAGEVVSQVTTGPAAVAVEGLGVLQHVWWGKRDVYLPLGTFRPTTTAPSTAARYRELGFLPHQTTVAVLASHARPFRFRSGT